VIQTYTFSESSIIPGIPGIWSAGHKVTIDDETFQVISVKSVIEEEIKKPLKPKEQQKQVVGE
jgi:hypothetical protein